MLIFRRKWNVWHRFVVGRRRRNGSKWGPCSGVGARSGVSRGLGFVTLGKGPNHRRGWRGRVKGMSTAESTRLETGGLCKCYLVCISATRGDYGAMSCVFAATLHADNCWDRNNEQDSNYTANNRSHDNINVFPTVDVILLLLRIAIMICANKVY